MNGNTPIGLLGVNGPLGKDNTTFLKTAASLPECQGLGSGTIAIHELIRRIKQIGIKQIRLYTDRDNRIAQSCYGKRGLNAVESQVEIVSNGNTVLKYEMEACL